MDIFLYEKNYEIFSNYITRTKVKIELRKCKLPITSLLISTSKHLFSAFAECKFSCCPSHLLHSQTALPWLLQSSAENLQKFLPEYIWVYTTVQCLSNTYIEVNRKSSFYTAYKGYQMGCSTAVE